MLCWIPHSVFRYLVSPRILKDYNWRNWESEHIPAIFSLLAIIAELKKNEKFQNQFVKDSFKNLSTDIVLTKQIIPHLEKLPNLESTLASEFSDNEYKWRKVPSLSIYSQDFEAGYQFRQILRQSRNFSFLFPNSLKKN